MSIITNAKEIADLVKKLGNVDLYRKIVELEGEIIELAGRNNHLVERTRELEQALKIKESLVFSKNVYWVEDEESRDGPYCQRCYDVTGKLFAFSHGATTSGPVSSASSTMTGNVRPNPAVERTCAKSRAGRSFLRSSR